MGVDSRRDEKLPLAQTGTNDGSSRVQKFKSSRTLLIPTLTFGQIEFAGWTPDGHLRHSKFVGLRDDKDARSVIREHN
jgi:ATP-dependent DNA ligase